jgi:hypothetical protein
MLAAVPGSAATSHRFFIGWPTRIIRPGKSSDLFFGHLMPGYYSISKEMDRGRSVVSTYTKFER